MGEPQKQLTFGLETLPKVLMFLQSFSERLVGGRARGRRGCPALPRPTAAQRPGRNPASATACVANPAHISPRGLVPKTTIYARTSPGRVPLVNATDNRGQRLLQPAPGFHKIVSIAS